MSVSWQTGDPALRAELEAALDDDARRTVLFDNERRRVMRVETSHGSVLVKHFRLASGRHRTRETLKRWIGRSPVAREWRALRALADARVPVPEPLAWGFLANGDGLLALGFVEGTDLAGLAGARAGERRAALVALGRAVRALHRAGYEHGDLHQGNVRFGVEGPVLLDLQHARRRRGSDPVDADLGQLDYSLWPRVPLGLRMRMRIEALGLERPLAEEARAALRRVGAAAEARAAEHARSRTRRCDREGRRFAAVTVGELRGLRDRALEEADLRKALDAHASACEGGPGLIKADTRSRLSRGRFGEHALVVKEVPARGIARAVADVWRGSAGWRAWRGGHGLSARGVGAARPFAVLERRRFGLPLTSWIVLEDLGHDPDALRAAQQDTAGTLASLLELVVQLHRRDVVHGDLKSTHVHLTSRGACLIDLDGVRFDAAGTDDARIQALAELNASLPDAVAAGPRREAFDAYARRLPFRELDRETALRRVIERSLARRHRWTGAGCEGGEAAR